MIKKKNCIKIDEFCIKNDEFCVKSDEFCVKSDECVLILCDFSLSWLILLQTRPSPGLILLPGRSSTSWIP